MNEKKNNTVVSVNDTESFARLKSSIYSDLNELDQTLCRLDYNRSYYERVTDFLESDFEKSFGILSGVDVILGLDIQKLFDLSDRLFKNVSKLF